MRDHDEFFGYAKIHHPFTLPPYAAATIHAYVVEREDDDGRERGRDVRDGRRRKFDDGDMVFVIPPSDLSGKGVVVKAGCEIVRTSRDTIAIQFNNVTGRTAHLGAPLRFKVIAFLREDDDRRGDRDGDRGRDRDGRDRDRGRDWDREDRDRGDRREGGRAY